MGVVLGFLGFRVNVGLRTIVLVCTRLVFFVFCGLTCGFDCG